MKIIVQKNIHKGKIVLLVYSQAPVTALNSNVMNSRTVYDCLNDDLMRWRIDMIFISHVLRDIRTVLVTAEWINWPEEARLTNSLMSFLH